MAPRLSFFSRTLSQRRFNGDLKPFSGFEVQSAMTSDGQLFQAVILGPHNRGRKLGGKAKALELASDPALAPRLRQDWAIDGQVDEIGDEMMLVHRTRDVATRIVRTGVMNQAELAEVVRRGGKPRWHGIIPIQPGAAKILLSGSGEDSLDFDITGKAVVKIEEGMGKIRGFKGPMLKDTTVEVEVGGGFYSGYLGGELEIHHFNGRETVIYDVTNDPTHQRDFQTFLEERAAFEAEQAEERRKIRAAAREAEKAAKAAAPLVIPADHVDA